MSNKQPKLIPDASVLLLEPDSSSVDGTFLWSKRELALDIDQNQTYDPPRAGKILIVVSLSFFGSVS